MSDIDFPYGIDERGRTATTDADDHLRDLIAQVLFTAPGREMIVMGISVGFLFALFAMMLSVVSFPLLLDRDSGLDTAIAASFRAVLANPGPMALWGLIVAALLLAGSALAFVGLMVAIPVLGHATWHLYRKLIV